MSTSNLLSFRWKGKNRFGQQLKGQMAVQDAEELILFLRQQGIVSFRIRPVYSVSFLLQKILDYRRCSKKALNVEILLMLQQLSMLLSAQVPLMQAFDIMESSYDSLSIILRKILKDCRNHIQMGHTLSQAFTRHSKYFSEFFCRLIAAGEYSGTLDVLLEYWISYQNKHEQIRQKIKKALSYPLFILSTAIIVAMILFIVVMPLFEKLFHQMGAELPPLTQIVIQIGMLLKIVGIPLLLFFAASLSLLLKHKKSSSKLALWLDKKILITPFCGKIILEIAMIRFSRTLSILLSAGFPLSEALKWTSKVMNNRFLTITVEQYHQTIISGQPLSQAVLKSSLFSSLLTQMIMVGEASGTLDKTLAYTADFYEKMVLNTLDKITQLIEPIMMIVIGIMTGTFILAMYLPIFKLGALF